MGRVALPNDAPLERSQNRSKFIRRLVHLSLSVVEKQSPGEFGLSAAVRPYGVRCSPLRAVLPCFSKTGRPPCNPYPTPFQSKRRLREAVLELLVAVASSSRPGADGAAQALAASSLPPVVWREFLAGDGGGGSAGVLGWSWWERGDAEGGGAPLAAR